MAEAGGRRSKWDQTGLGMNGALSGSGSLPPGAGVGSGSPATGALDAAAAVAAKINAMLMAKGRLRPGPTVPQQASLSGKMAGGMKNKDDLVVAEVEINDVPHSCRNLLTRGQTQDEVSRLSGAAVSTRGRFMSPEEKAQATTGDRALCLHIQGQTRDVVDKAVHRIKEIIANGATKAPVSASSSFNDPMVTVYHQAAPSTHPHTHTTKSQAGMHYVQDKVFVGLEPNTPSFNIKEKVEGPGGSYLQHIQAETGAKVFLRGKGSGCLEPASGREAFEPMYIYISHPKHEGLSAARKLCESLLQTVHSEHARFLSQMNVSAMTPQGYQQVPGGVSQQPYYPAQGYQPGFPANPLQPSYPGPCGPNPPPFLTPGGPQPLGGPTQKPAMGGYVPTPSPTAVPGYGGVRPCPLAPPPPQGQKRRFTEESEEESPLLGYQHGPIHMTNLGTGSPLTGRSEAAEIYLASCRREPESDRQLMPPPPQLLDKGFPSSEDHRRMYGPAVPLDHPDVRLAKLRRGGEGEPRPPLARDEEEEAMRRRRDAAQSWSSGCRYALPAPPPQQQMPFWMAP